MEALSNEDNKFESDVEFAIRAFELLTAIFRSWSDGKSCEIGKEVIYLSIVAQISNTDYFTIIIKVISLKEKSIEEHQTSGLSQNNAYDIVFKPRNSLTTLIKQH